MIGGQRMMEQKIPLVVVAGPTASGKTAAGVYLAKALNGEVVSADSMQIYKGMDIGTGKLSREEMRGVRHHMIDVAVPDEEYSVGRYVKEAAAAVVGEFRRCQIDIDADPLSVE